MNIHEYQAKQIFRKYGVPVPRGFLAASPVEAEFAMRRLKVPVAVIKAQVHAGGRGKGGGVKLVKSPEEAAKIAQEMIGMTLVTHQTGSEGKLVRKVYVEEGSKISSELYLALLVDRETASVAIMFSTEGGMNIEEVAENTPEKIITVSIDPMTGLCDHHIRSLCFGIGLDQKLMKPASSLIKKLYKMFTELDFSLLEINPLIISESGEFFALDGKMNFDDNALFRHPEIEEMRDFDEEDAREVEASKFGLNFIGLDGNIACLVNGAGLAMATMDIIQHFGGSPANFLDVGGGATEEMVTNAFRIILTDEKVKSIFVNIFGGIMRCDTIANGLVAASKKLAIKVPIVVRLEGTNVEIGKKVLADSGLDFISVSNMADGGKKAVEAAKR